MPRLGAGGQAGAPARAPARGQLVQTGWSPDRHTQAFQSGSWLGRKVEQPAALLTLSFAVLLVCSTARAGQEGRQCPRVCCSGDREEAVPSLQVPVGLLSITVGVHKGTEISTSFWKSKQAALTIALDQRQSQEIWGEEDPGPQTS